MKSTDEDMRINRLLTILEPLYPQPDLPQNEDDWDEGRRALSFFVEEERPKLLLPTWLCFVVDKIFAGMHSDLTQEEATALVEAVSIGNQRIKTYRNDTSKLAGEHMHTYRAANCGALAQHACGLLWAQGVESHIVNLNILENGEILENDHNICLYTKAGTPRLSFEEMVRDLSNPAVRILDLWTAQCGPAQNILNNYAKMWVFQKGDTYMPCRPRMDFVLEEWWAKDNPKLWVVGKTYERFHLGVREPAVLICPRAECYQKNATPTPIGQAHSTFKKCATWKRVRAPWEMTREG